MRQELQQYLDIKHGVTNCGSRSEMQRSSITASIYSPIPCDDPFAITNSLTGQHLMAAVNTVNSPRESTVDKASVDHAEDVERGKLNKLVDPSPTSMEIMALN